MIMSNDIFEINTTRNRSIGDKNTVILTILFAIIIFSASNLDSSLLNFSVILLIIYIRIYDYSIFLAILFGVAIFADFFILDLFFYSDTFNRVLTVICVLTTINNLRFRKSDVKILIATFILLMVGIISIVKIESLSSTWFLNIFLFCVLVFTNKNINFVVFRKSIYIFSIIMIILLGYELINSPFIDYTNRVSINDIINTNRLGMAISIYGVIILSQIPELQSKFMKVLSVILYILCFYIILITGSRNSLLAYSITSFIYFTYITKKHLKTKILFYFSLLLLISLIIFVSPYFEDIEFIRRFSFNTILKDKASMRLNSYPILVSKIIPGNFLIGIGIGGQEKVLSAFGNFYPPAHNLYLSSLTEIGLFGFGSLLFLIGRGLNLLSSTNDKKKININMKFVYINILLLGLGETIFNERFFWIALAINIYAYNDYNNNNSI